LYYDSCLAAIDDEGRTNNEETGKGRNGETGKRGRNDEGGR
jgi:hypothetical protein